jgi:HAD superfamily hydrolase (TIGR01509 family)
VPRTALVDLDGTLVDTNYHHAIAWFRAFREHGIVVPLWRLHRAVGMGGDQLVQAVAGAEVEERHGDPVRAAERRLYLELIEETEPLAGARELLAELRDRGHRTVLASSAQQNQLDHYLERLQCRELVDGWTTADDVEETKPEPDLVAAALAKVGGSPEDAVMVGDTGWDVEAAGRLGIETVCVLTGGWSATELREAGAAAVYESPDDLRAHLDETPLR